MPRPLPPLAPMTTQIPLLDLTSGRLMDIGKDIIANNTTYTQLFPDFNASVLGDPISPRVHFVTKQ
ncbi:hypothetical protein E2C01_069884 [Portunus trituberculatus]|uniref:Uncharacterized protein n=1 Tax=Portunus trituberculatus TaxID=210409 RepID=A0A5B7I049_PORTR|nr:hypothetical protein [Portunus trituberculatus]